MTKNLYLTSTAIALAPMMVSAQEDVVFLGTILLTAPTLEAADGEQISLTSEGLALRNPADISE